VLREAKLVGFLLLLIVIFVGAHLAGSALGPVNTGHSQVSVPGAPAMNMAPGRHG
jgi:hypothetical protein